VFHLLGTGAQAWPARGIHVVPVGHGKAAVSVENLSGKVNPNTASLPMLQTLIGLCGRSGADASRLAQAIVNWHTSATDGGVDPATAAIAYRAAGLGYAPPGKPFQTDDELGLVVGMTPATLACLAPHMSVYQDGDPTSGTDDTLVARALAMLARQGGPASNPTQASPPTIVRITSTGTVVGGRFARRAVVRLSAGTDGRPFNILTWEIPAP
jgi:hypothetical protein